MPTGHATVMRPLGDRQAAFAMTAWSMVELGTEASASEGTIDLTFPSVVLFPIDDFHARRGLVGSSASRSYFSFAQNGTTYGVDTSHEGSGANCTTWNTALSG